MIKKLLFVSHSHLLSGGAELSLLEIVRESLKLKYDCLIILPAEGPFSERLEKEGISYKICKYTWSAKSSYDNMHSTPDTALYNADSMIEAYKTLNDFKPDTVITNTIMVPWFLYVASAIGIPNIMIVREAFDERNSTRLLPTASKYLKNLSQNIDYFLFNSEYAKSMYSSYFKANKQGVLHPSVKIPKEYQKLPSEILEDEKVKIIIPGSIVNHKNQLEVVEAIGYLDKLGHKDFILTIMGRADDDAYINKIKTFIDQNNLQERILLKDFTSDPFAEIVKNDIVVIASRFETFGRVTLEGQLLGRVVIGSNSGGTLELIEDQTTGLLYEEGSIKSLADKLLWVTDNKKKAREIALAGKKTSKTKFNSTTVTKPLFKILNDPIIVNKPDAGNLYYEPFYALMERNIHADKTLRNYADSLENAIETIEDLNKKLLARASLSRKVGRLAKKKIKNRKKSAK